MISRHSLNRRRLLQATLSLLATPCASAAQNETPPAPDLNFFTTLNANVRAASMLLLQNDFLAAHALLSKALAEVESDPARRWPWRLHVLPVYGFAELGLGRTQGAVDALHLAIQAQDRIKAENVQPFAKMSVFLETAIGLQLLKVEYGRQMLTSIGAPTALRTVGELPYDTAYDTAELWFTMARALHANRNVEELARFYRQRIAPMQAGRDDLPALVAQEYRHFKIGLLLWQAGQHGTAAEALTAALHMNSARFSHIDRSSATMEGIWSSFAMRRTIISAQLEQARQRDSLDINASSLLQKLILAKGGAARYQATLMRKLDASTDMVLREHRMQMRQLEDQIAALPQTMTDASAFMQLAAMHGLHVSQVSAALHGGRALPDQADLDLAALQQSLGKSVVIGFFVYAPPLAAAFGPAPPRYLRYCVTASSVTLRDLGPQRPLEQAVHRYRAELMSNTAPGSQASAALLARLLLQDLPEEVLAASEWILDPDAALHLLPFDALPDAHGKPLAMTRSCRHVSSLLQLLNPPAATRTGTVGPACIFANPAYGAGLSQPATATMRFSVAGDDAMTTQRLVAVAALPDTTREADAVATSLRKLGIAAQRYEGAQASACALQAIVSPIVLHVAAHAILGQETAAAPVEAQDEGQQLTDMLLPGRRAGLLLSRAGQADLMLANDIARLPLDGTQLVVLSACNTGNGTVLPGEGLASLRRAVEMAGAHSSITSLWSVPSEASTELMRIMYGHISNGMAPGTALHQARQVMISQGRPPLDWAGFVFAGNDAPLAPRL